uniref:Ribosomal protein S7 n=1 Tax=Haslea nusantara TaxID=2600302 RepID=A0A5B8HA55_9STRA|nr:ribosomal protein S7 [Haslea nusantara]QDX17603.1 ribosomal protein S7 [Haslea nusantara]
MRFSTRLEKKLKYKIVNHFMVNGNKATCEKALGKSLKQIQKVSFKSHSEITKLAILNATPIFRIIELQQKRKKKRKKGAKNSKEIPAFLSQYNFRTSWALKLLLDGVKTRSKHLKFSDKLHQEIISTSQNVGASVSRKTEIQKQALKKKSYLKYYRW